MPRTHSTLLAALGSAAALALSACGDGGSAGAPTASGDGTPSVQADIAPVGPADEGIDGVESYRIGSSTHTNGTVDYGVRPPPGGPHNPVWANCGFYDQAVPDEHVVHDLEHGAVWIAYSPDLPDADVEVIHDLARANDKVIATPYAGLPAGAATASAWGRQLVVDSVDDPRLAQFVVQYQDGSQAPEAGASCTQSPIGDPIP